MPLPPLVLSMGDPAGVGPAITAAAWDALKDDSSLAFYVIGAPDLYSQHCPVQEISSPEEAAAAFGSALPVFPVGNLPEIAPGKPDAAAAPAICLRDTHSARRSVGSAGMEPVGSLGLCEP